MAATDDQIPRIPQTEKDEIEEGSKVDHLIGIPDTNGQDPSGSQTNKSINEIFDEKFKDLDNSTIKSRTMFKVNVWLRESNEDAYTPKMVSIGPYHKTNVQLHPMEKYKLLFLRRFLGRKEGLDVESCIKELEGLKEEALKCYDDVKSDEFCEMLLLDGCFVVEFIREYWKMFPEGEATIINDNIVGYIGRDLLLLENQLPFFVLDKLHDMTKVGDESKLVILVNSIFLPFFDYLPETTAQTPLDSIKHLLHLKHAISCHGNHMEKPKDNDGKPWHMIMRNATELSEAGVRFKKVNVATTELSKDGVSFEKDNVKTTLFDSIKFKKRLMKNPCFTIPCFQVDDNTETILRNLIAYEQQSVDVKLKYFSNFATFMDKLIESDKDVNLLCQQGVIENWLGDDKAVATLFNKIGNGVVTSSCNFYYKEECRKAVKHCKIPWNKYGAIFCEITAVVLGW